MINKSITLQFILLATVSIIVSTILTGFMGYNAADNAVIEKLKTSDLTNIVSLKAGIISVRMNRAIETSKMLAADPVLNKWFLSNEQDMTLGSLIQKRLTQITELYDYSTVFAVSNISKHYWKQQNTLSYTLSEKDPKDSWFFLFLKSGKSIDFNLDSDKIIGGTHIFINTLMGTPANPIGLAGVGLNVTSLAQEFSKIDKYEGKSWLIDDTGNVKISNDQNELGMNLGMIIGNTNSRNILDQKDTVSVYEYENSQTGKMFLAHAPISGTDWIVVYAVSYLSMTKPLITIKFTTIVSGLVSVILVVFTFYFVSHRFTRPIRELTQVAEAIAEGDLDKRYHTHSINEVGVLANAFNKMTENLQESNEKLKEYNQTLEQKVSLRTAELSETLKQVSKLKEQQDGDYYLTSLITSPLFKNFNKSSFTKTEFLMKQKKKFTFRKKAGELGGDICLTGNLSFNGRRYTLFTNADAMGKSMQGAGGAIVFGTVLNSILSRSASNKKDLNMEPSVWLTEVFQELNKVFHTFDGSMLVSCVIGLVNDESGELHYFNSEHPYTILYRDGIASFLESSTNTFKLGTMTYKDLNLQSYYLQTGDVLIAGSDGRDDILLTNDSGKTIMNEDEKSFLRIVEKGQGDLNQIYQELSTIGEQFDDMSFIRIGYDGPAILAIETEPDSEKVLILIKKFQFEEALHELRNYQEDNRVILLYYKALCLEKIGCGKDAISYLERILNIEPMHSDSLRLLAHIHSRAGRYDESFKLLQRVTVLKPENKKIKATLLKIKSRMST